MAINPYMVSMMGGQQGQRPPNDDVAEPNLFAATLAGQSDANKVNVTEPQQDQLEAQKIQMQSMEMDKINKQLAQQQQYKTVSDAYASNDPDQIAKVQKAYPAIAQDVEQHMMVNAATVAKARTEIVESLAKSSPTLADYKQNYAKFTVSGAGASWPDPKSFKTEDDYENWNDNVQAKLGVQKYHVASWADALMTLNAPGTSPKMRQLLRTQIIPELHTALVDKDNKTNAAITTVKAPTPEELSDTASQLGTDTVFKSLAPDELNEKGEITAPHDQGAAVHWTANRTKYYETLMASEGKVVDPNDANATAHVEMRGHIVPNKDGDNTFNPNVDTIRSGDRVWPVLGHDTNGNVKSWDADSQTHIILRLKGKDAGASPIGQSTKKKPPKDYKNAAANE